MKAMVIFGTRPEAIKLAPVINLLKKKNNVDLRICVTGQQREMLYQAMRVFEIDSDYDLQIMQPGQSLGDVVTRTLTALDNILDKESPDLIMVHGDTSTTFAASLAAFYKKISVAHIEAGLRTGDIYSPWPEEMNRRLTGVIAAYHFAPTLTAKNNLLQEGVSEKKIWVTGNTVIDALHEVLSMIESDKEMHKELTTRFSFLDERKKLILVTGHRRENFGEGFENICFAIREIAARGDVEVVYPVHLNPNVQEPVRRVLANCPSVHLIEPLEYVPFVYLMNKSYMVITDSGGIQEEAPALGKPVLVMRDTTERPEAVEAGTARLVGTGKSTIVGEVNKLMDNWHEYQLMSKAHNPYGDGKAAQRIVEKLINETGI